MTFTHEESLTTAASPADVWALWSDVGSWHAWDPAVQQVALEGHFAEGAGGTMLLAGGIEAAFVLEVVEPGARYLDRLTLGDLVIRIDHQVAAHPDGARLLVRTTVEGPGAEDVGPMVTQDAPVALAALARLAEAR
ncbi:SRPBCC family protein [Nocardioides sp. KIGAM211]|uniref:SRPBCC family protein n=1 Tax=Nocardioides luti TaxID=2761101 RepID=A0A7X0RJZ9_9ACTN|nr:SRPBCC family protein [Nocardioides luti]MBB6628685.1 SRPBCC family protein [Nocardioides luti]